MDARGVNLVGTGGVVDRSCEESSVTAGTAGSHRVPISGTGGVSDLNGDGVGAEVLPLI